MGAIQNVYDEYKTKMSEQVYGPLVLRLNEMAQSLLNMKLGEPVKGFSMSDVFKNYAECARVDNVGSSLTIALLDRIHEIMNGKMTTNPSSNIG